MTCALEHKREMVKSAACKMLLDRLELVVFSDLAYIVRYLAACTADITKFACGRITVDFTSLDAPKGESEAQHSQVTP